MLAVHALRSVGSPHVHHLDVLAILLPEACGPVRLHVLVFQVKVALSLGPRSHQPVEHPVGPVCTWPRPLNGE